MARMLLSPLSDYNGVIQMLRITERIENGQALRLRLDGTLSADSFRDFADAIASHATSGRKLTIIDMAGVGFMDDDSARRLLMMLSDRVKIINCSPFIETLLATIGKRGTTETSQD
jgi:anti-anti-sigma regulatory factor